MGQNDLRLRDCTTSDYLKYIGGLSIKYVEGFNQSQKPLHSTFRVVTINREDRKKACLLSVGRHPLEVPFPAELE